MSSVHPLAVPDHLREAAVRSWMAPLGADAARFYLFGRGGDSLLRVFGSRAVGANTRAASRWSAENGAAIVLTEADPDHFAPLNRLAEPPPDLHTQAHVRWAFMEVGYRSGLCMNAAAGDRHRGFVAFVRATPAPWVADAGVLQQAARRISAGFCAAWDAEALLRPPGGSVELTSEGELLGDAPVVHWARRHDFQGWVAAGGLQAGGAEGFEGRPSLGYAPGSFCRVTPFSRGRIYTFDPIEPMILPPILTALTPKMRRVASLAASGATTAEIAAAIGRSVETVRHHLEQVYRILGVTSRSELTAVARRMLI